VGRTRGRSRLRPGRRVRLPVVGRGRPYPGADQLRGPSPDRGVRLLDTAAPPQQPAGPSQPPGNAKPSAQPHRTGVDLAPPGHPVAIRLTDREWPSRYVRIAGSSQRARSAVRRGSRLLPIISQGTPMRSICALTPSGSPESSALPRAHGYAEQRIRMHSSRDRQLDLAPGLRHPVAEPEDIGAARSMLLCPVKACRVLTSVAVDGMAGCFLGRRGIVV
jgi:hypothetical protein